MTQIEKMMKNLDLTKEEAMELMAYDKEVDHAKAKDTLEYDLTPEQQKIAKKYTTTTSGAKKPFVPDLKKPTTRKVNPTKQTIMEAIFALAQEQFDAGVEMVNKERQIKFQMDGHTYELTLTQKRGK